MEPPTVEFERDPRTRQWKLVASWTDHEGIEYHSGLRIFDDGHVEFPGVWKFDNGPVGTKVA